MYLTHDILVHGGSLRVGEWRPADPDALVVIALHGMLGSHRSWALLAKSMPDVRIIAPDLRGRGMSAGLAGPYGVDQHVADLATVADALGVTSALLLGHSLGAFVAIGAAVHDPERFQRIVVADGGIPLTVPIHLPDDQLLSTVLGPAARGCELAFASREAHQRFWQLHPALAGAWGPELEEYADYSVQECLSDLGEIEFRPLVSAAAVGCDSRELFGSSSARGRLHELTVPVTLLAAGRGIVNESPGVYSCHELEGWRAELPGLTCVEVPEVNHFTLVLGARGVKVIARELRRELVAAG